MRIFTKKAFEFNQYEMKDGQQTAVKSFAVRPQVFTDAPDWIREDDLFKWAKQDGDIEVLETTEQVKTIEGDKYVGKSNKDLYNMCLELGIKAEAKQNRAYYVELLNTPATVTEDKGAKNEEDNNEQE